MSLLLCACSFVRSDARSLVEVSFEGGVEGDTGVASARGRARADAGGGRGRARAELREGARASTVTRDGGGTTVAFLQGRY